MPKTLALFHTTPVTLNGLKDLAAELLPAARIINILDDSLLPDVIQAGTVTPQLADRITAYIHQAERAGADALLCCCSSLGDAIAAARPTTAIPLLRIDEPMAEAAVRVGPRIGVIATVGTTLGPTVALIEEKAAQCKVTVQIEAVKVDGAYQALTSGNPDQHDALVLQVLQDLLTRSDVIVLAQASLARVASRLPEPPTVPILSSPVSGLQAAAELLMSHGGSDRGC